MQLPDERLNCILLQQPVVTKSVASRQSLLGMKALMATHCPIVDQHGISARPDTQPLVSKIKVHTDGLRTQGCWQ